MIEDLNYSIFNFKAINTDKWMKLAPITIFCGVNSSGKSSIIQSHLVMSQTIIRDHIRSIFGKFVMNPKILAFEGKYCHLEGFKNVIFENNLNNELKFKWKFKRQSKSYFIEIIFRYHEPSTGDSLEGYPIIQSLSIKRSKSLKENINEEISLKEVKYPNYSLELVNFDLNQSLIFESTFRHITSHLRNLTRTLEEAVNGEKIRKEGLKFVTKIIPSGGEESLPELTDVTINNVKLRADNCLRIKLIMGDSDLLEILTYDHYINLLGLREATIKRFDKKIQAILTSAYQNLTTVIGEEINSFIKDNLFNLNMYYESLRYLGPLREEPKRFYTFPDFATPEIGLKGENTPLILIMEQERKIKNVILEHENEKLSFSSTKEQTLLEALNIWLKKMDLQEIRPIKAMELITRLLIEYSENQPSDSTVSLPDVGFGVSQIFPVLVESLRMDENETLILEQPEIHLHPRLQGDLADFLLCQASLEKKFLIETHSEHFLTRLYLRIAQFKDVDLSKLVKIYFTVPNPKSSGTRIIEVKLDEFGQITNWPKGFFDDNETGLLLEESRKKKREFSKKK